MSARELLVCDRCQQTAWKVGWGDPAGWATFLRAGVGHLCPDCTALVVAWVARRAELDEKDPTDLLASPTPRPPDSAVQRSAEDQGTEGADRG